MSGVFISYRRSDAQAWAGRLGADLATAFGDVARFFDLASIAPGADYMDVIERAVADADAVLVLIGPQWADTRDSAGRRRLEDPDDVVAAEIAQALKPGRLVIPVLLGSAEMPASTDLPEPLRPLRRRNAIELSECRWAFDCNRLFDALEAASPLKRRPPVGGDAMSTTVSVGSGLTLTDAEVGNIAGLRGATSAVPGLSVDVLQGARLQNVKVGDITGVDFAPTGGRTDGATLGHAGGKSGGKTTGPGE
jgi:hypothetical protein